MRKLGIIAAMLLLAPAVSQAKTLEELLVEKGVITKGEASGASSAGGSKVYWNDGTRLEFPDSGVTTKINTYIETRYSFHDSDVGKNISSFDVNKARLAVSGTALHNEFSYYLQADFVGAADSTGRRSPDLLDAYIQWNACDWASLRMGQFKTFIGRQFVQPDQNNTFPNQATATGYFNLGRQQGAAAAANYMDGMLEAKAGIFNGNKAGEGRNLPNSDTRHSGQLSLRVNPTPGFDALTESDVNHSDNLGWSAGVAYAYTADTSDDGRNTVNVDAGMKWQGLSVNGEFFVEDQDATDSTPVGAYVQAGYFLLPKKFEIAGRWSIVDCDSGKGAGTCSGKKDINEGTAGLNYYWQKNNLKAQVAYVYTRTKFEGGADSQDDNKWILQLVSFF